MTQKDGLGARPAKNSVDGGEGHEEVQPVSSRRRWTIREMPIVTKAPTMIHFQKWMNRIRAVIIARINVMRPTVWTKAP